MSRLRTRADVTFSADGGRAACVAADGHGGVWAELWALTGDGPQRVLRVPVTVGEPMYPVPLPGDRVLGTVANSGGYWELVAWDTTGEVASRPARTMLVARVPVPDGPGLALALAIAPEKPAEIVRVDKDLQVTRPWGRPLTVARIADWCAVALPDGRVVTAVQPPGQPFTPLVLDPASGHVAPLPLPSTVRAAVPVCANNGRVVLAVAGPAHEPGLMLWSPSGEVEALPEPVGVTGQIRPLALAPDETELLVRSRWGAVYRLWRVDVATGEARPVDAPAGSPWTRAGWTRDGLWLPLITTTAPMDLWWTPTVHGRLRPVDGSLPVTGVPGHTELLPGAAGPVEAVVHGDWRTADRVVVALHGGPAEHWELRFDPLLQAFARAGFAVVAPNPRGSTGYGRQFEEAIKGDWGGPDLADVLALATHLVRVRGVGRTLPVLYGVSYGAFLALLAAAEAPSIWAGCAAVAPFTSTTRLYREALPPVRALLDRLEATSSANGGPRDLLRDASRMRGRVLLVHGDRDPVIPVDHSRQLAAALAGSATVDLSYLEVPGAGHPPVSPRSDDEHFRQLVRFLEASRVTAGHAVAADPVRSHAVLTERR